jgi:hypothetical protein
LSDFQTVGECYWHTGQSTLRRNISSGHWGTADAIWSLIPKVRGQRRVVRWHAAENQLLEADCDISRAAVHHIKDSTQQAIS